MTENHLARALGALDRGDDAEAVEAIAAAWRGCRAPRLAELAGLVAGRSPSPLAQSLAGLVAPRVAVTLERWESLGDVDDPLLATWVLDALERPPFTGPSARPLLEALVAAAERLGDPRLVERAPAIAAVWEVRVTPKPARVALAAQLARAVERIRRTPPPSLEGEPARLVEAIAARLGAVAKSARTVEELYADVYANPRDDGPRLVLADALLERGDPRGELIMLQFKRRDGALDDAGRAREQALLKKHGKAWLGPLAPIISWGKGYSGSTFERGFLSIADIILSVGKKAELVLDEPSWATVEELQGAWPNELLERAPLRALRRVDRSFTIERLRSLSRPLSLSEVSVTLPIGDAAAIERALPELRQVTIFARASELAESELASLLATAIPSVRLIAICRADESEQLDRVRAMCERLVADGRTGGVGELVLVPRRWGGADDPPIVFRCK